MLKTIHFIIFVSIGTIYSFAQNKSTLKEINGYHLPGQKGNGLTKLVLKDLTTNSKSSFISNYYKINRKDSTALVSGILKLKEENISLSFANLFFSLTKISGRLYTFSVALHNLQKVYNHSELDYISLSRIAEPQIGPSARKDARIDVVHQGSGMPMPYTGKGQICGLVDIAIDYSNPAFRTRDGDSLRIIKAWAQNRKNGFPPAGLNYGVEFSNSDEVFRAGTDSMSGLHGTITAGSMAASGFGSNGLYSGAAPDAKIIAISSNGSESSLLDAMRYFFDKTAELNKRGIFNLSWGSHVGPHDGTSLFDQAIDSLVSKGGIIIGAAGNWADDIIHLKQISSSRPAVTSSVIQQWDTVTYSLIDIWGKPNSTFNVQIKSVNKLTGSSGVSTENISTSQRGEYSFNLVFGEDTSTVYMIVDTKDQNNNRPNCLVAFLHNHVKSNYNLTLNITSINNEVHAWGASSAIFSEKTEKNFILPGHINGDNQYTVGELGGTSKSIITIGAHVSQRKIRNILGSDKYFAADSGQIEPFSSYGPTLDGRIKPDLTAPGSVLAPVNSFQFDVNYSPDNRSVIEGSAFAYGNKTYYWIGEEATSFAAPVVTGAVAVLLEANPSLSYLQIRNALIQNTTQDNFTGNVGSVGSNRWGYGKLNLYKALSSIITVTGVSEDVKKDNFWSNNPVNETLTVFSKTANVYPVKLTVIDLYGRIVMNQIESIDSIEYFHQFDLNQLETGQYVGIYDDGAFKKTLKISKINP